MGEDTKRRRRTRGSAWHWRQTDCWYYTPPGTRRRVALLDSNGQRIRGKENRQSAELALARVKVAGQWRPTADPAPEDEWVVARVCSEYLAYCQRRVANGTISKGYCDEATRRLNQLSEFCGRLSVSQLSVGHIEHWLDSQTTWRSPATGRTAISIVVAAFNYARETHDIPNRLTGLKRPPLRPRLLSFNAEDEAAIYEVTDEAFGDFLFAAIHTGLRPFCELARMTANDIVESDRGMMWRVYATKTRKTRKIPVRAEVAALTRRLTETAPTGSGDSLFRNARGGPWTKVAGVGRFVNIKKKLGWDADPLKTRFSCYICRHTFAHRMLAGYWNDGAGCTIEVLAELMGDTPKVAFEHYGREWGQHYQEPLWAAVLGDKSGAGPCEKRS